MTKKENLEEFNLSNKIDNKLKRIKIYQELKDIEDGLEKNNKNNDSNDYLKILNENNARKRELEEIIHSNGYTKILDFELDSYKRNNFLVITNNKNQYNNFLWNSEEIVSVLSFSNCKLIDFNFKANFGINSMKFINSEFIKKNLDFNIWINDNIIENLEIIYLDTKLNKPNIWLLSFSINNILIQNNKDNNWKFQEINIKDNKILDKLLLDNFGVELLNLENINNNFESFEIRNCKIDKLVIKNSNLWKAVFNWVEIWELEIVNATLNDCIFNWVDFWNYKLWWNYEPKIMKDNYRQLKFVMDKNNNFTGANKFYALEMQEYMNSMEIEWISMKTIYNDYFNWNNTEKLGEKIKLIFSNCINNFWNNWIKNLIFIFILATISNLIIISSLLLENVLNWFILSIINLVHYFSLSTHIINFLNINLISDFLIFIIIILAFFDKKINSTDNKNNYKNFKLLFIWIILFFLLVSLFDFKNFNAIKNFIELLYPLYWFEYIKSFNEIELIWFFIYKIIYWILIWNLWVALKRTTKR